MQTNGESARKAEHPGNGNCHSLDYDQGNQNTAFDGSCEVADVGIGLEAKYKRRSLDILQAISDTTNVTLSTASRQAWKRYENQTAIKRHRPCSRILKEPLFRDPLQDLLNPGEVSAVGLCLQIKLRIYHENHRAFVTGSEGLLSYTFLILETLQAQISLFCFILGDQTNSSCSK